MAQFIVLPKQQNPWVQQLPTLLQNMALQKIGQNFREKIYDKEQAFNEKVRKEQRDTKTFLKYDKTPGGGFQPVLYSQAPGQAQPMPTRMGSVASEKTVTPENTVRRYNFAMQQYLSGKGPNPGPYNNWLQTTLKSGATNISLGDKVALHKAKSDVNIKQSVRKSDFPARVAKELKAVHGDNWDLMSNFEKQESVFRAMDKEIKEAYGEQEVVFDERNGKEGWWIGNKLIRRWVDPTSHRRDKKH